MRKIHPVPDKLTAWPSVLASSPWPIPGDPYLYSLLLSPPISQINIQGPKLPHWYITVLPEIKSQTELVSTWAFASPAAPSRRRAIPRSSSSWTAASRSSRTPWASPRFCRATTPRVSSATPTRWSSMTSFAPLPPMRSSSPDSSTSRCLSAGWGARCRSRRWRHWPSWPAPPSGGAPGETGPVGRWFSRWRALERGSRSLYVFLLDITVASGTTDVVMVVGKRGGSGKIGGSSWRSWARYQSRGSFGK